MKDPKTSASSTMQVMASVKQRLVICALQGRPRTDIYLFGLIMSASNSSQESRSADQRSRNSVAWRGAEQRFKGMQADVLVIFDCCEAGTLQGDFRTQHSFEFLGACSRDQLTPGPGKQSFTRALIWALCQLKDSPGFDSAELKEKIISAPHADDEPRTPVLFPRDYPNFDHVWISPKAPKTDEMASDNSASPRYREDQPTEFLDLRFRFSKRQTEQQVQRLADAFSQFAGDQGSNLGIRRVELMDYASKFRDVALSITSRKRLEIDYSATPVSNENDEREEYGTAPITDTAKKPSSSDHCEVASSPEVQNLMHEVEERSLRLFCKRFAIVMVSFLAGVLCTLFFWYLFFFAPYYHVFQLWEFLSLWGLPTGERTLMLGVNNTRC